ncbi:hypothetical protein TTRE_0000713301 [Trichuris trichiura]|uniref:BED-type domain-containing protein n=1 Tax=Trichuris trichiura TaxID=36087 RepID=A0A077ZGN9_TRITR|nr:hypothetical protein TTRE_0000713301 [Trichuris trichiura]
MSASKLNEEAPSTSKVNDQQSTFALSASAASKRRHRSGSDVYWKRYCTRDGKSLICLCCAKTLSYANCSSTSFKKHLSAAHGIFDPNIQHATAETSGNGLQRIRKIGRVPRKADLKVVQDMCCKMVFKDRLPLNFWKKEGAAEFLRLAFPAFSPPHPAIVKSHLISAYNQGRRELIDSLAVAVRVSLSFDYWTCQCPHSYLAITVHYLNSQEELQSRLLDFKRFTGSETAEELSLAIASVLDQFALRGKVQRVTTGLEERIVKAVKMLDLAYLPCFAQILHAVVSRGLNLWPVRTSYDAKDATKRTRRTSAAQSFNPTSGNEPYYEETSWYLDNCTERFIETGCSEESGGSVENDSERRQCLSCLEKCRKIISFLRLSPEHHSTFNRQSALASELSCKQLSAKLVSSLPLDVQYCWCSTANMIGSFLNHRQMLDKYFAKMKESKSVECRKVSSLGLTEEEWNVLKDLQNVLLPFLSAVNVLSAFRYPTIGLAVMCEQQLRKFCLTHNQSDSKLVQTLKSNLQRQFEKFYGSGSALEDDLLKEIAYLNPSFHGHMSRADFLSARNVVHRNLAAFIRQIDSPFNAKPAPPKSYGLFNYGFPTRPDKKCVFEIGKQNLFDPWYFRSTFRRNGNIVAALNDQSMTTGSADAKDNSTLDAAEQMASDQLDTYEIIADRLEHQGISGRDFLPPFKQYASLRMSIPALSMPSEQAFSASGYLQRKELAANNVVGLEMMTFVCES